MWTAGISLIFLPNFSATSLLEHKVKVKASVKPDSATACRIKSERRFNSNWTKSRMTSRWTIRLIYLISDAARFRNRFLDVVKTETNGKIFGDVTKMQNIGSSDRNRHSKIVFVQNFTRQTHSLQKFRCLFDVDAESKEKKTFLFSRIFIEWFSFHFIPILLFIFETETDSKRSSRSWKQRIDVEQFASNFN